MLPLKEDCLCIEAIEAKAIALGLQISEIDQLQFLQSLHTLDVQAAPGCGKTTLTGVKLCLLASSWHSDNQGVCVLSHTNVAKDQIREMLTRDSAGKRFLSYPHYIGTIQGFVDTFLAFPHLRSSGLDIRVVDPDIYGRVALTTVRKNPSVYPKLEGYLKPSSRRTDILPLVATAHYVWRDQRRQVIGTFNNKPTDFPFSPTAPSAVEFYALKDELARRGFFLFEDMYALGYEYLQRTPSLLDAIRFRFPYLLIDEMQDTSSIQERLLEYAFPREVHCVQRVGDINQRIYSDSQEAVDFSSFPVQGHASLSKTMRFGESIASAASHLTASVPFSLQGNGLDTTVQPVLILFDENSVGQVLEEFARIAIPVLDKLSPQSRVIKAVCARKNSSANKFPSQIATYWPEYRPDATRSSRPGSLIEAAHRAKFSSDRSWSQQSKLLFEACADILTFWGWADGPRRPTSSTMRRKLSQLPLQQALPVREALRRLLVVNLTSEQEWDDAVGFLCTAIKGAFDLGDEPNRVKAYCSYKDDLAIAEEDLSTCTKAIVWVGGEEIEIHLDTIHAVKGETHHATLVLEAYNQVYDLREVLPIILGKHDPKRLKSIKSIEQAMRTTFVAMTRPKHLVAFAVNKEHVEHCVDGFVEADWLVHDLTVSAN